MGRSRLSRDGAVAVGMMMPKSPSDRIAWTLGDDRRLSRAMHVSLRIGGGVHTSFCPAYRVQVVEQDEMIGRLGFWPTEYRHMHGEIAFR